MTKESDTIYVLADYIEEAGKYGLIAEVVLYSLRYMKDNPKSSIEDAISYGFYEWVK